MSRRQLTARLDAAGRRGCLKSDLRKRAAAARKATAPADSPPSSPPSLPALPPHLARAAAASFSGVETLPDERRRRILTSRTSSRRLLVIPEPYVVVAPPCCLRASPALPPRPRCPRGCLLALVRAPLRPPPCPRQSAPGRLLPGQRTPAPPSSRIGDVDRCAVYVSLAPGMENPTRMDLPEGDATHILTLVKCHISVSAASDVDTDNVAGQRTAEPAAVVEDAAQQAAQEQPEEQPAVVTAAESAEEHPAPARTGASTPIRGDETVRTPPPSSVAEEENRAPTTPSSEGRTDPTPPRAEASSPMGSPSRDQGPVIPVTAAGGSAEGEEHRAASNDEVEEIQGRPHDGRQHVYVWRQRGDHFIGHEELTETEEAARVERAAKRHVDEVKIEGIVAENKALSAEVHRLRSEAEEKTAEMGAQEERLLDLNRRLADKDRERRDLEEEVARLRQEKEKLDQERASALEAGRRADEELRNKSQELTGKNRVTLFFDYSTFLVLCVH
ncbi:proline-rich protein 36-like [Sorghum bicolor]|uniref:proline-rich protein 36-like n=1 Tax=Sorghum bicolor TaxID=4558 RepID=UPI000B423A18|nr:proline-rich protein 36-like [Sorghum bicolor]|eukprot:XP_021311824.1 proline-rich protein 36-like [Sorghum bicolor]